MGQHSFPAICLMDLEGLDGMSEDLKLNIAFFQMIDTPIYIIFGYIYHINYVLAAHMPFMQKSLLSGKQGHLTGNVTWLYVTDGKMPYNSSFLSLNSFGRTSKLTGPPEVLLVKGINL